MAIGSGIVCPSWDGKGAASLGSPCAEDQRDRGLPRNVHKINIHEASTAAENAITSRL